MADDPSFEKKTEQLLVFLQNQVLELQRENLQHKATLTALEHYVLRLLHSGSASRIFLRDNTPTLSQKLAVVREPLSPRERERQHPSFRPDLCGRMNNPA
jgi:hypothetical protein